MCILPAIKKIDCLVGTEVIGLCAGDTRSAGTLQVPIGKDIIVRTVVVIDILRRCDPEVCCMARGSVGVAKFSGIKLFSRPRLARWCAVRISTRIPGLGQHKYCSNQNKEAADRKGPPVLGLPTALHGLSISTDFNNPPNAATDHETPPFRHRYVIGLGSG